MLYYRKFQRYIQLRGVGGGSLPLAPARFAVLRYPLCVVKISSQKLSRHPQISRHVTPQRPASPRGSRTNKSQYSHNSICNIYISVGARDLFTSPSYRHNCPARGRPRASCFPNVYHCGGNPELIKTCLTSHHTSGHRSAVTPFHGNAYKNAR